MKGLFEKIYFVRLNIAIEESLADQVVFPFILGEFCRIVTHVYYAIYAFILVSSDYNEQPFVGMNHFSHHGLMECLDLLSHVQEVKKSLQDLISK